MRVSALTLSAFALSLSQTYAISDTPWGNKTHMLECIASISVNFSGCGWGGMKYIDGNIDKQYQSKKSTDVTFKAYVSSEMIHLTNQVGMNVKYTIGSNRRLKVGSSSAVALSFEEYDRGTSFTKFSLVEDGNFHYVIGNDVTTTIYTGKCL